MRPPRATLLLAVIALPLLAGPARAVTSALAPGPAASLEACVAGLDSLDIGYERIEERCPGLTAALEGSEYAAWLPADWKRPGNELSAAGLAQLRRLLVQEQATHSGARMPAVAHLAAVLARLPPSGQPSPWRTRLTGALRSGAPPPAATAGGVLAWLGPAASPPAQALYVLLGLAVLLAAVLAGRELRLAGLRWPRPPGRPPAPPAAVPAAEAGSAGLGNLLAAIAARLAAQGRLPASPGLTARELAQAAQLPPAQRAGLLALTRTAEALRYGPVPPADAELAAAVQQGRRLLASLSDSP